MPAAVAGHGRCRHRIDRAVRAPGPGAARAGAGHPRGGPPLHPDRRGAGPRTAGAGGTGAGLGHRAGAAIAGRPGRVLRRPGGGGRTGSGSDRQGRRRRHPHPPARRLGVQRLRPSPAVPPRSPGPLADRAQRPPATQPAQPGAGLATGHRRAGRPGHLRRTDHRQHRHRAAQAHQPAHRGHRHGAGGRRFPAGVRVLPGGRPGRGGKFRLGPAGVPRGAADRWPRLHQGHRLPAWPDRRAHLLPARAGA